MNRKSSRKILFVLLFFMLSTLSLELLAQCPMCSMAAESNLANGGTEGRGLNNGIFYILAAPYLIVFTIGFIWWRRNGRLETEESKDIYSD